jgi:hypothetical protein
MYQEFSEIGESRYQYSALFDFIRMSHKPRAILPYFDLLKNSITLLYNVAPKQGYINDLPLPHLTSPFKESNSGPMTQRTINPSYNRLGQKPRCFTLDSIYSIMHNMSHLLHLTMAPVRRLQGK